MSQQSQGSSTSQTAKDEASSVAQTAADSGGQVASTARDEGQKVVGEAMGQARNLVGETRDQLSQQAGSQQERAAGNLHSISDELQTMASSSDQPGLASELVRQAAGQVQQVAGWLDSRDPQGLLEDVRNLARRRPGAFLLGSAFAGLTAGRLTRAGVDAKRDTSGSDYQSRSLPAYSSTTQATTQTRAATGEGDLWPVGGSPVGTGTTAGGYDTGTAAGHGTGYEAGYDPVTPVQPAGTDPSTGIPGTTNDPAGPPR